MPPGDEVDDGCRMKGIEDEMYGIVVNVDDLHLSRLLFARDFVEIRLDLRRMISIDCFSFPE